MIEHTLYPVKLLSSAYKILNGKDSLVIAEVPHWDSFGTVLCRVFSDTVFRHLGLGHINCFTRSSLIHSFKCSGFNPISIWYFGMDAFELVSQLSYHFNNKQWLDIDINVLQSMIDKKKLTDEIILAGKPSKCK